MISSLNYFSNGLLSFFLFFSLVILTDNKRNRSTTPVIITILTMNRVLYVIYSNHFMSGWRMKLKEIWSSSGQNEFLLPASMYCVTEASQTSTPSPRDKHFLSLKNGFPTNERL